MVWSGSAISGFIRALVLGYSLLFGSAALLILSGCLLAIFAKTKKIRLLGVILNLTGFILWERFSLQLIKSDARWHEENLSPIHASDPNNPMGGSGSQQLPPLGK